jgi:hypothetical protein
MLSGIAVPTTEYGTSEVRPQITLVRAASQQNNGHTTIPILMNSGMNVAFHTALIRPFTIRYANHAITHGMRNPSDCVMPMGDSGPR